MSTADSTTPIYPAVRTPRTSLTLDEFTDWLHSDSFPHHVKISYLQGQLYIEPNVQDPVVVVPHSGMTLDEFTEWTYSKDFPERGRITYVNGKLIIDVSPERVDLHAKIKGELTYAMIGIVKDGKLGEYYPDGVRFKNPNAGLSHEPDGAFATWETLRSGKLAPPSNRPNDDRHVDLVGVPDWVCEILSDSSEIKDTRTLFKAYHKAGIREYWLIDARDEEIDFQILVWVKSRYQVVEPSDGWHASPVFGREFQLIRSRNQVGRWEYELGNRTV